MSLIDKTIFHYKILEKLGAGGMGVVYKAQDTKLDRFVALKFLPPHLSQDEEGKKRFIHEAKAASALNHPNIATIYEIDEADGQMFIAMEYIEGQDLKSTIDNCRLSIDEALDYALQIAEGLAKAHSKGIVHRDIKPANILVTEDGVAKIVDFGLAKLAGATRLTKEGTSMGTVAYMSPEQTHGIEVDHRTDIWSLGIVLYEMLAGEHPFKGDYEQAVIYSIINEEPLPIVEQRSEISPQLTKIVERALQKNVEERFQKMADFLAELKNVRSELSAPPGKKTQTTPSIAVLPFVNMSPDPENEFFSDGLAEELINGLTKIKSLQVVARTSAFSFKGKEIDIREIGKRLNVETVLEGSVRKAGNRLRITAQLINVDNGYHLWSERYDRDMEDVFAIQDEISLAIVERLRVELLGDEKAALVKRQTANVDAYSMYLQGRYYWNKRTVEGFRSAIEHFEEAIAADPTYALAYAGLADSYALLGDVGHNAIPPKEAFTKSGTAVEKALALDATLAEAHASLAHLKMHHFEWQNAEKEFKRAIKCNPNYATAYHWYAFYFALRGRTKEAIATIKQALELDPVSLAINIDLGVIFYYDGQYDKAIAQYRRTLEMEPRFVRAYVALGSVYGKKEMYDEAIDMCRKALELSGDRSKIAVLARAHALAGRKKEALGLIDELHQLSRKRYISHYSIALIYACLPQKKQALEWLRKAYQERVSELIYMKVDPYLDKLRSDSKFKDLLEKVGLDS